MAGPRSSTPRSRKASKHPLTRERILAAAIELIERDRALTMRRLGSALGVEGMSIYHHFESRDALLAALDDHLLEPLGTLELGTDWREACRRFATALREIAVTRPATFRLLGLEPFDTPASLRCVERLLTVLVAAGFAPRVALGIYRATVSYARGYALAEATGFTVDAAQPEGRRRLAALDPEAFPVLCGRAEELAGLQPDAGFRLGLDALVSGFPGPAPGSPGP